MNNIKIKRLNNAFVEEISKILFQEIKDPDISFVTITSCDITSDLSFAKVYYTVFDVNKKESTQKALEKAATFIRGELSKRVEIRHTPELKFIFDTSIEYGERIEAKIKEINERDNKN